MKKLLFLSVFIMLFSFLLQPQVRSGNIYGTVSMDNGNSIPGVKVTLTSPVAGKMVTITSEKGNYRFLSLPPSKDYELKFELTGFKSVTRKNIRVIVGDNVTVNILMETGEITEFVEITAKPAAVDTRKTTASVNLTQEILKSLPTARDPWAVLEMAPGVMLDRQNVGGNESGQQSSFSSRGEGRANSQWNVDGVDVTDPTAPGTSGMYYDFEMFEEMQIQTAANDVTAMTGGVNINFVTRRGSDRLGGSGHLYWAGDALQGTNIPSSLEAESLSGNLIDNNFDYGINVGGPIKKGKVWFWLSYGVQDIGLVDTRGDLDETLLRTFNAKVNFTLGKHRLELYAVSNDKIKEGRKRYPLDYYEASRKQTGPAYIFKVQDEFMVGQNTLVSLKLSYTPTSYKLEPYGGRNVPMYEEYRSYRYNTGTWEEYDTSVFSANFLLNHYVEDFIIGDHELKFGLDYRQSLSKTGSQLGNGLQLITVDGYGYYARVYREWKLDYFTKRFSAFFQDTFTIENLTFLLGLRYDNQKIGTKDITIPGTNIPEVKDVGGIDYNWNAAQQKGIDFPSSFSFLSPRLGMTWDFGGNGKNVLKANWAIYGSVLDSGYLNNFQVDSYHDFDWYDDGDLLLQADELDLYKTNDNYGFLTSLSPDFFFSDDLKPEKDMEFLLGFEKELFEDTTVGINLIYRNHYDLNWAVPYVWDGQLRLVRPDDWSMYSVELNGKTYYYWDTYDADVYDEGISKIQKRPDYKVIYKGLELTFRKAFSNNWMLGASLTLQDTRIHYDSRNAYIDPTDHEPNDLLNGLSGPHSLNEFVMNSRWMAKVSWLYRLPWGVNFSGKITAREGYILPKIATLFDEYKRWWDNEKPVILVEEFSTTRYPDFMQLDLRLDKSFTLSGNRRLVFSLEGFNITNADTALQKGNDISLSEYDVPIIILNPRVFRLGMRVEF